MILQAWHIESSAEFSLDGPVGEVYSMVVANEMLFAGAQVTRAIWLLYGTDILAAFYMLIAKSWNLLV